MTDDERANNTVSYWLKVFDEAYRLRKSGLNKEQIETSHAIDVAGQSDSDAEMKNMQRSSTFIIKIACAFADDNKITFDKAREAVEHEIRAQIAEHTEKTDEQRHES